MVGAGYYAKMLCSGVFVSERPADAVIAEDVLADQSEALELFHQRHQRGGGSVGRSRPGGFAAQRAIHRDGYGCHLELGGDSANLPPITPWPRRRLMRSGRKGARRAETALPAMTRAPRFDAALDDAFAETDPERAKRTRAVAVVHRGRLVAERYAEGFNAQTPQLGWSMAKSVTNALAGRCWLRGDGSPSNGPPP